MIEINLLPPELKPRKEPLSNIKRFKLLIPSALIFIFSIHMFLFILFLFKNIQYNVLNKKWQLNKKDLEKLEIWKKENQKINQDYQTLIKLSQQRILIYPKLNFLGKTINEGMWFKNLRIKSNLFHLEGSVVSTEGQHISIFRAFCDNLKQDKDFFKDFLSFEIGPLKTRKISSYEILDFIIEAKLK